MIGTYCFSCENVTKHKILFAQDVEETEDDYIISTAKYLVIECLGCTEISFLIRTYLNKKKTLFEDRNYPDDEEYYFLDEVELSQLPAKLASLYDEVENAFISESEVLAGTGLRTLVEAICIDKGITGKNLIEKINKLHSQGFISSSEKIFLDKLRLIGNASTHGKKKIPIDKLEYALEIVNHVLKSIYILPKINKKLKV